MASDILNNELFSVTTTDKKDSSSKPKNEIKKEGNSLFSTLLEEAKTKVSKEGEVKTTDSLLSQNISQKNLPSTQKKETSVLSENLKLEKKVEQSQNIVPKETQTVSLLDKMIQDLKGKKEEIKEVSNTLNNSKIEKKETSNQVKSESKEEVKTTSKATSSLLDKMIQDFKGKKEEINEFSKTSKIEEKATPNQVKSESKDEAKITSKTTSSLLDKMTQEIQKNDGKKEETKEVSKTLDSSKTEQKVTPNQVKSESKDEAKITSKTTSSLLDKGLQEIKDTKIISTKIEEVSKATIEKEKYISTSKETHLKVVSKEEKVSLSNEVKPEIGSELKTVILELNPIQGVSQLEHKKGEIATQNRPKTTQENTILETLSESISGKTKSLKKEVEKKQFDSQDGIKAEFGANMFLSNQKTQGELVSKKKMSEAKEILQEGEKTTKTILKSAEVLGLKAKNIELTLEEKGTESPIKSIQAKSNEAAALSNQQSILNRMFFQKENSNNSQNMKIVEEKISDLKATTQEAKKTNTEVTVTVERTLVETFTTKVIASKQMMGSFMSDVARNMYLNYKPPVTALRINLDPINLGNISIVMRNNKSENSLSISLNMSQNATLETFNDNKTVLQNALGRVFNTNDANISLDFGLQNENSNQEFEQFRQGENNKNQHNNPNGVVKELKDEIETLEIQSEIDYM